MTFVEHILARVAERGVTKIMGERKRLGEIVVKAERPGQRSGNLTHFKRMGEPGAEMVALMRNKDLGFMGKPAEGRAMNDTVTVTLKFRARWRGRLRHQPAPASRRIRRVRCPRRGQSESGEDWQAGMKFG